VYEDHYGLKHRPFVETVSPTAYVALPSRDASLRRLRYGLEHGGGPALLYGPPGSGKSLVAARLAQELGARRIHLPFPLLPPADLLVFLAEELAGPQPHPLSTPAALRCLTDHLAIAAGNGSRPLLIVDEAQLIQDPDAFETLRLLQNFASTGPPDLLFLLVGTAELLLQLPPGLADRLTARCLLGAFTESESSMYVLGRLATAGAVDPLFSPEAISALHRAADGLPRRLSHLADLCLLIAYAEDLPQADARIVSIAAREFQLDTLAA
jgi:type II secretory pathway predicted ATPase ExeA